MSLILLIKIILLIAALKLYNITKEALYSALLYSVPLMLIAIFNGTAVLNAIIGGSIILMTSYIYFVLQAKIPRGAPTYALIGIGALLLLFVL